MRRRQVLGNASLHPFVIGLPILLAAVHANAQEALAPAEPVLDSPPRAEPQGDIPETNAPEDPAAVQTGSQYTTVVHGRKPSPAWTQDRSFSTTRLWLLDPGSMEVATWSNTRIYEDGPNSARFRQELEIGIVPHLQLDLYAHFRYDPVAGARKANGSADTSRRFQWYGYSVEARVAIPNYYGQIPTNPVIYLEWIGQPDAPGRVEARLLLGGAATHWLFLAANPYVELNVQPTDADVPDGAGGTERAEVWMYDAEAGSTLAAGFGITDWFRLSLEIKIGADMLGDANNGWHFVWWIGPGLIIKPFNNKYLKIVGTFLFNLPVTDADDDHDAPQKYEPVVIVSSEF